MKKFLVDIYHIPQYNLFKNALKFLEPNEVDLCCVNRGKLVEIIKKECPAYKLYVFGDYKNNNGRWSLATKIVIPRVISLYKLILKNKYCVVGNASYQASLVSKLLGVANFAIMDDPRKFIVKILKFSTKEFYLPPFRKSFGNAKTFNALKEWAYLSPKYFKPSTTVLEEYNFKEKGYLFIREVSTNTSNYLSQEKNLILQLSDSLSSNTKVVLSLEDKSLKDKYPKSWIILEEPVSDIHSLMYFSSSVISSGDSMAREGGMLGVPSIYLGNRDMPANKILIDRGILWKLGINETVEFIYKSPMIDQIAFRHKLEQEWDDVTQLILDLFDKLKK